MTGFKSAYVVLDQSLLHQLQVDYSKVSILDSDKQTFVIIDDTIKVTLPKTFKEKKNEWNTTNIQLCIDKLVEKGNQPKPIELYKKGTYYRIMQMIDIKYNIKKQRANAKRQEKYANLSLPQFGFIGNQGFKGDFDVAVSQQYIDILNQFYKSIEEACIPTIKSISQRKNFGETANIVEVATGKTEKGEWTTKRIKLSFQKVYKPKDTKDDQLWITTLVNSFKKAYPENGIILQKKDYIPEDAFSAQKCNSYEKDIYELHMNPVYIYGIDQKPESILITRDGIISLFKDLHGDDNYSCVIQPLFQYGIREKQSEDDPDSTIKYVKYQVSGVIYAIESITPNESFDAVQMIGKMAAVWTNDKDTDEHIDEQQMFGVDE